jgi:putative peptidoglycan lipid II flippase
MLGAVVVTVVFVAVAYLLDRHDVRPLAATVARRVRRQAGDDLQREEPRRGEGRERGEEHA